MRIAGQSAIEYLMTYGWALIIIIIVLAVLYSLHVFTPGALIGANCAVNFKYSCENPVLSTNGTFAFILGQNTGQTDYNLAVACVASTNSSGLPYASAGPWRYLSANAKLSDSYNSTSAFALESGKSVPVSGSICYTTTGEALTGQNLGNQYTGQIWIRYTALAGPAGQSNPFVAVKVATLSVQISSVGGTTTV